MPELPDVVAYLQALERHVSGRVLEQVNCATCQTGGKRLADRALSRLLKDDWPKSIDNL